MSKISWRLQKWKKNNDKTFFVFKMIAFESQMINSHNIEEDTCHWKSMCYETQVRFTIYLREIFSKSCCFRVVKKYDKSALMLLLQEFETL